MPLFLHLFSFIQYVTELDHITHNLLFDEAWAAGFRIRIHFLRIRIRIQRIRMEVNTDPATDPDPDPDPGL
jgi:hypothetical protein